MPDRAKSARPELSCETFARHAIPIHPVLLEIFVWHIPCLLTNRGRVQRQGVPLQSAGNKLRKLQREHIMIRLNRTLVIWGVAAAMCLSAGSLLAQNDNGGGGGGGGFGRGNFDPAQFQQRMMEGIRDQLGFTNDADWNAVQPLVQKVMDARRDVGAGGGFGRMFRNRGGNGDNANGGGRRGGFFGGQPSPEAEALQKTIDDNSPPAQIKAALARYQESQKAKQAKLTAAQDQLRQVLSVKQEAQATLLGLLN